MYDIHNLELEPLRGPQSAATSEGKETPADIQKTPQSAPGAPIFTLHLAHCRGKENNAQYPSTLKINGVEDLKLAAQYDHMPGKMVNNYRHSDNFMECDCLVFDVDNTHTDEPDGWIRADDIAEALPVSMFLAQSRHYMKPKEKINKKTGEKTIEEPREKWHGYCPLSRRITNKAEYERLIKNVVALFPFVDISAIDAARFFYGVQEPHITYYEPESPEAPYIDTYIAGMDPAALKEAQTAAIVDYTKHVKDGSYKNDKANRATVKTACELLGYKNPLPEQSETIEPAPAAGDAAPDWMQYAEQAERETWFLNWAQKYHVEVGKRYTFTRAGGVRTIAYCVACPWEEEHSAGKYPENEAAVFIEQDGKISFKCRHRHGDALNWRKYRAYYEAQAAPDQGQEPGQDANGEAADYLTTFFGEISGDKYKPYRTGLKFFDDLLNGGPVKQTMLMLLAAPAAGKTTLCQQIAESIAENGKPVMYINLEMSREQMIAKSISARVTLNGEPMTSIDVLQGYRWRPEQREAVAGALDEYRQSVAPQLSYNPDGVSGDLEAFAAYLETIGERARAAGEAGPVVVLDYLHLLTKAGEDAKNVIIKAMEILKGYAKNYDTVSIVISATNRVSNAAGRITMDSGRDSSGIEYTGDYILSLNFYQVDQGQVKTTDTERIGILTRRPWRQMIIRVLKNRWGIAGKPARVYFHAAGNRFYAEDDFLPTGQSIIQFGDPDPELENGGMTYDVNNLMLPEIKTPKAGRKR